MDSLLCYIMIVALLLRPNAAMSIYVIITVFFTVCFANSDGYRYFLLAVTADTLCALLLSVFNATRKTIWMIIICVLSIIMNLFGFMMWYSYKPPDIYVAGFTGLYIAAIFIILKKDGPHVGRGNARLHINSIGDRPDVGSSGGNFDKGGTTI